MSQNNPPFAIGQKVVSLISCGPVKKGDPFIVLDIFRHCCTWHIDIGIIAWDNYYGTCPHGKEFRVTKGKPFYPEAKCFAPAQSNYSDATAEILEKFKSPNEKPDKVVVPEKIKI